MPKKTRKQKQRAAARRQGPSIPGGAGLSEQPPADAGDLEVTTAVGTAEPPVGEIAMDASITETPKPAPAPRPAAAAPSAARRRIERLNAPAAAALPRSSRIPSNAASMFAPLESDDAAIPFDRVPYVRADLRRVAIMASLMVVLIIIAAIVVSHVVK